MRSMIDVIEQLHGEFGAARARTEILAVTDRYREQLESVLLERKAELLDRLSRQQLLGPADHAPAQTR